MMAYWEAVVSLDRQDMLGSWHQKIVAICLSQTGHLNAISLHALTRFELAYKSLSFFILYRSATYRTLLSEYVTNYDRLDLLHGKMLTQ
jgi:hypothetical protein